MGKRATPDRFWKSIEFEPSSGCWIWVGKRFGNGYGSIATIGVPSRSRRYLLAHRFVYEQLRGPIPPGMQLDHLCRLRPCVNPAHLEPVTCQVNLLRGNTFTAHHASKTHCDSGHPFDAENTYRRGNYPNYRYCRACRRSAGRRSRQGRRARTEIAA